MQKKDLLCPLIAAALQFVNRRPNESITSICIRDTCNRIDRNERKFQWLVPK